ncbi:MAG: hypothetical protein WC384_01160 [Prolixibacteraceae bacterium]
MKKLLLILISGFFLMSAYAQKGKKDIVYLKSGAVIKGQLTTHDSGNISINSAGNLWVFKNSEVDSISKFEKTVRDSRLSQNYFFDTSVGVLVGNSGNSQKAPFSFTTSMNFRIIDKLYVGAGLGTEFFGESYMPVFAQFQYKFRESKLTPFVNLQVGYQVPLEDSRQNQNIVYYDYYYYPYPYTTDKLNTEGGYLINPSVGFQWYSSENFGWFFSFGYRHHQLNYSGTDSYKLETNFSRLSLRIGFIFN